MNKELPKDFLQNCIFLLGAGASKDANIPLTNELYNKLVDEIENGYKSNTTINPKWSKYLKKFYELTNGNFEHTIAIIKYLSFLQPQRPALYLVINFLTDFENKLIEGEEITKFFHDFWTFISHQFLQEKLEAKTENLSYLKNLMELAKVRSTPVFTLNYDDTIEKACEESRVNIQLGFKNNDRFFSNFFEEREKGINLYKLHGSINWKYNLLHQGDYYGQIFKDKLGMESPMTRFHEAAIIMGEEKLETKGHFLEMLFEFRQKLNKSNNLCIVGYSFQDKHINKFLKEWYYNNTKDKNVLIIDPNLSTDQIGRSLIAGGREIAPVTTFWNVFQSNDKGVVFPMKDSFQSFLESWKFSTKELKSTK